MERVDEDGVRFSSREALRARRWCGRPASAAHRSARRSAFRWTPRRTRSGRADAGGGGRARCVRDRRPRAGARDGDAPAGRTGRNPARPARRRQRAARALRAPPLPFAYRDLGAMATIGAIARSRWSSACASRGVSRGALARRPHLCSPASAIAPSSSSTGSTTTSATTSACARSSEGGARRRPRRPANGEPRASDAA